MKTANDTVSSWRKALRQAGDRLALAWGLLNQLRCTRAHGEQRLSLVRGPR